MEAIKAAVTALVESNFAMSKFLELINVIISTILGFVAEDQDIVIE